MKNLSRILIGLLCFAPFAYASAAPVATTNGSNLTSFNPSTAYNNQWATMSNGRYDNAPVAKVDFGNCNAVVLRCAQPKCANGGCSDISIASAIVNGCVQSNEKCKQYGDDLVQYMAAQLVASSNAKINEQNVAAQQAASQQSQQQMQQMQYQMQQMQQQMAEQQAQSQQQIKDALAQQAAQSQAAIENMKSAATAAAVENEAGISAYQQDAINRDISRDILEREKLSGQVLTEIENAEVSLKEVKAAMQTAFEYAKCDARGNNCTGPKRIKKWRELAREFVDPYTNTLDKVYNAFLVAQNAGVDLSQIYMMLSDSCESWGQYMCPHMDGGEIDYGSDESGRKNAPRVCKAGTWKLYLDCYSACISTGTYDQCNKKCSPLQVQGNCQPCTLLKTLTNQDDVYDGWVNAENDTGSGNTTVVACASGAVDSSKFFAPLAKRKKTANLVDMDMLELWLDQVGSDRRYDDRNGAGANPYDYCYCSSCYGTQDMKEKLRQSALSKSVNTNQMYCASIGSGGLCNTSRANSGEDAYINPIYAICDVHPYNSGKERMEYNSGKKDSDFCTEKLICDKIGKENRHCDKIVWAKMEKGKCTVKLCQPGYKPKGADNTAECEDVGDDGEWGEKGLSYQNAYGQYRSALEELYGDMKEVIGLKTTVISQQMYKQYEYLNATLRRIKIQLEKATLNAKLQVAGAKSDDSSSGLLGGGSSKTSQYANCSGKDRDSMLYCLRSNYSILSGLKKCDKNAQKQIKKDLDLLSTYLGDKYSIGWDSKTSTVDSKCEDALSKYNIGIMKFDEYIDDQKAKRAGRYRDDY